MEPFEIKDLYILRGRSGLYRYKAPLRGIRNGKLFESLIDPANRVIVRTGEGITRLSDVEVYVGSVGNTIKVETIIDRMYTAAGDGEDIPAELSGYGTAEAVSAFIERFVPEYDRLRFKLYHMNNILRWYHDISTALDMLDKESDELSALLTKVDKSHHAGTRVLPITDSDIEEE